VVFYNRSLCLEDENGILSGAVECVDIQRNIEGENNSQVYDRRLYAKARGAKQIRYLCSPSRKR